MVAWLHFMRWLPFLALLAESVCSGGEPPRLSYAPSPVPESRRAQEEGKHKENHQSADPAPILERFKVVTDGSYLLLPVELKGKGYWFALDTGSSNTVYDTCFRSLLGDPVKTETVETPGRYATIPIFRSPQIKVGKLVLPPAPECFCMDLGKVREISGQEVLGLIGMDVLKKFVVRIDFDCGEVAFLTKICPDAGKRLPIVLQGDRPYVRMEIRGLLGQGRFLVDTGSYGSICGSIKDEHFDILAKRDYLKLVGGVQAPYLVGSGTRSIRYGCVNAINLADFCHENLVFSESSQNVLGLGYWSRYVVTFDFPNNAMYLKKSRQFDRAELYLDRSGLAIRSWKGQTLVVSVGESTPAAQAGIKPQDVLLKIGDVRSSDTSLMQIRRLFCEENKKYRLLIRRGEKELEFTLHLREKGEGPRAPSTPPPSIEPHPPRPDK